MGLSHLYPSQVSPKRSGKRQVMSPTDAHLPMPSITVFHTTAAALLLFLLLISFEGPSGNSTVNISCYQLWLFRGICPPGFCLAEPQVHRGQPCCLSCLHHCLFALHTFLAQLSNKPFLFSYFYSCKHCILHLVSSSNPRCSLLGSLRGVEEEEE